MELKDYANLIDVAFLGCVLALLINGNLIVSWNNSKSLSSKTVVEHKNSSLECYSNNSESIVDCVVSDVRTWFIYNVTDDSLNLSLSELKSRGGDCKDWSEYYIGALSYYNFTGEMITFEVDSKNSHAFALVHKDNFYCTIDEVNYKCHTLEIQ